MLYFTIREEINKIFGGTDGKNETAFRRKPSRFIVWSDHLSSSMTCAGLAVLLRSCASSSERTMPGDLQVFSIVSAWWKPVSKFVLGYCFRINRQGALVIQ